MTPDASAKWPMDKPITIIVNWPAGHGPDAYHSHSGGWPLQKKWGNTVLVENRPGSTGNIGQAYAARAEPDGYTWLHASPGPAANNMISFRNLPYNPLTDFTYVTQTSETDMILDVAQRSRQGLQGNRRDGEGQARVRQDGPPPAPALTPTCSA